MIFDEEVAVSSDDNLPCSLLMSLSDSACRVLWFLMKSFLSSQWESLRSGEGHSAENVKAHGICWVMRPFLAHRNTESPFLLSNLKCIETSGKQTQEKLFPKHLAFRLPIALKKILRLQGVEGDEFCSEWDWKKGATQHAQQKIGPEYKLKTGDVVAVFVKAPVMKRLCWSFQPMRAHVSRSKPCSTSRHCFWGGTVYQGHGWLIVWSLDEERENYVTCSCILHSAESWFRANIFVQWWSLP